MRRLGSYAVRSNMSKLEVLREPAFLGLLLTTFVLGLTSALVLPFASMWATQSIGMSPRTLGTFVTINSLSAVVVSTFVARFSDTVVSRRTLLFAGGAAGALGYLGFSFLDSVVALTLVGSTLLAFASINFAQLFAHAREELGRDERRAADAPFLMGVLRACFALAWTVGPMLGAALVSRTGYRGNFLCASALFLVFLACNALFIERRQPRAQAPARERAIRAALGLDQPRALIYAAAFALMFAAFTLNTLNLPLYLTQALGGDEQAVGRTFAISPLFEMLLMVWFGHLATRGHELRVLRSGALAAVIYFLALRLPTAPSGVYPLQLLNAAAVAVTTSVAIPFFQDLLPHKAGVATSLYSNALKLGGLLGSTLFGLLASAVGNRGLFLVCAALSGATLVILVAVRPRAA